MYLHDWEESGFIGVVSDFEGLNIGKEEYEALEAPYSNAKYWLESKEKMRVALESERWRGVEILLASYTYENYSGDAFVLFRRDGKLYEVNGGHCSCYGLEDQWLPEETSKEELLKRLNDGRLGASGYSGNEFAGELRTVLDNL